MAERTIRDVLDEMDEIVEGCRRERSRLGYFAALYRKVTRAVQRGIEAGRFVDGARMERLDVIFADRYLAAYRDFRRGEQPTRSWQIAFQLREQPDLLVLQHLLLGMNAHINLDLGIAAARACPGADLAPLQQDFNEINRLLGELFEEVQDGLGTISPLMWMLDQLVTFSDRFVVSVQMERARDAAWGVAQALAPLPLAAQGEPVARLDRYVFAQGLLIADPLGPIGQTLKLIARAEPKEVVAVIDCLA